MQGPGGRWYFSAGAHEVKPPRPVPLNDEFPSSSHLLWPEPRATTQHRTPVRDTQTRGALASLRRPRGTVPLAVVRPSQPSKRVTMT